MDNQSNATELLFYETSDGKTRFEVRLEEGTVWLTQAQIAELFQTSPQNITLHLSSIYGEEELQEAATCKDYLQVRQEGTRQVSRSLKHYNLPAILAVGYRVRSSRGTQFRQWATACLEEYLVKGFVLDDERLKNPPGVGVPDYFDELLERIKSIRASERRMYLRLRDIWALAADYDSKTDDAREFFQTVQNKLHFATTGKTAPETLQARADSTQPNMGLTTWKGDAVRKADVSVAKNYLTQDEISELNRIVVMFLDFAEDQANRRKQIFLSDWRDKLDAFLNFNDRDVLTNLGKVSREQADKHVHEQWDKWDEERRKQIEADRENDYLQQLNEAAKNLPEKL